MEYKNKVSVIIPVYNTKTNIKKFVDSILAQTLKEVEIVLVDCGSDDKLSTICDECATRYFDKLVCLHKNILCREAALNEGVKVSNGEYISFVDLSDRLESTMFDKLYNCAIDNAAEIVVCDYAEANPDLGSVRAVNSMKESFFSVSEYLEDSPTVESAFAKIIKREAWKVNSLPINNSFDFAMSLRAIISNCETIGYVPEYLYHHTLNSGTSCDRKQEYDNECRMLKQFEDVICACDLDQIKSIVRMVARFLIKSLKNPKISGLAEHIDFINKYGHYFERSTGICTDDDSRIFQRFIGKNTIPKTIFISCFYEMENKEMENECQESLELYAEGFKFVWLDSKNCDMDSAPECVREAYSSGRYKFVGDYFKLKAVYDHGGIIVDKNIRLTAPIDNLREECTFFGFADRTGISDNIFGSVAGTAILENLLATYEEAGIFKDATVSLDTRIEGLLCGQYGMVNLGYTQNLKEDVVVFGPDILSIQIDKTVGFAKLSTKWDSIFENSEYNIYNKDYIYYLAADKGKFWEDKERFKDECEKLEYEIQELAKQRDHNWNEYQNTLAELNRILGESSPLLQELEYLRGEVAMYKNSKSWKITAPLRTIMKPFRRMMGE